jgi:hypothetical protein
MNYKPVPKVAAGAVAGAFAALILAALAAYGIEFDSETSAALSTLIIAGLPVVASFAAAWLKTDPAKQLLEVLKAVEAERINEEIRALANDNADDKAGN